MEVWGIEDVVRECLWMRDYLNGWKERAWTQLRANQLKDTQASGECLRTAFKRCVELFPKVYEAVRWAQGNNYTVERSAEFDQAMKDVQRMLTELTENWPWMEKGLSE